MASALAQATRTRAAMITQALKGKLAEFAAGPMSAAASAAGASTSVTRRARTRVPTDAPESDGTLAWDATTIVVVEVDGGGAARARLHVRRRGGGAADRRHARASVVGGPTRSAPRGAWAAMARALRNVGRPGSARWRSRRSTSRCGTSRRGCSACRSPRCSARSRDAVPIYGSGGFTSYGDERLASSSPAGSQSGIPRVKMKVGRDPDARRERVDAARDGDRRRRRALSSTPTAPSTRKQALLWARALRRAAA